MTEAEWLACDDPAEMVKACPDWISDRRLRLFVCALFRTLPGDCANEGGHNGRMVAALEERPDGPPPEHPDGPHYGWAAPLRGLDTAAGVASILAVLDRNNLLAGRWAALLRDIAGDPFRPVWWADDPKKHARPRATFGGPSDDGAKGHPGRVEMRRAWLTPAAVGLARAAYGDRLAGGELDPVTLAALADALEEAGCPTEVNEAIAVHVAVYPKPPDGWVVTASASELMPHSPRQLFVSRRREIAMAWATAKLKASWQYERPRCAGGDGTMTVKSPHPLLAHLRSPGPHVRGCWAVDLVLGKE
jgi:hypothetical protein